MVFLLYIIFLFFKSKFLLNLAALVAVPVPELTEAGFTVDPVASGEELIIKGQLNQSQTITFDCGLDCRELEIDICSKLINLRFENNKLADFK